MRIFIGILLLVGNILSAPVNIAVLPFIGQDTTESNNVTDMFQDALFSCIYSNKNHKNHYSLIERSQVGKVMGEQAFQQSGGVDLSAIETGKLLGASHVVVGSVGVIDKDYLVNVRVIEIASGRIVATSSKNGTQSSSLVKPVAKNIMASLEGRGNKNEISTPRRHRHHALGWVIFGVSTCLAVPAIMGVMKVNSATTDSKNTEVSFQ